MQEQYEQLTDTHKSLLCTLTVFGNEYTEINFVVENFVAEKSPEIYEIIFDLSSQTWINLSENTYKVSEKAEKYIYEHIPPKAENCNHIIDFYIKKLSPPFKHKIDKNEELQLLKVLHRIQGTSAQLAKLNDYYAQYLIFAGDLTSAIKYFHLAAQIQEATAKNIELCNILNHLAEAYFNTAEYDKALETAFKSRNIAENMQPAKQAEAMQVYSYTLIYNVYFVQKKYKKAFEYSQKAMELAIKSIDNKFVTANIHYEAAMIATQNNNFTKAQEILTTTKEKFLSSINNKESLELDKKITELQKQITELQKINKNFNKIFNNKFPLILLIITLLALIIFLFFYQ